MGNDHFHKELDAPSSHTIYDKDEYSLDPIHGIYALTKMIREGD